MSSPRLRVVVAVGVCVLTSPIVGFAEPGSEPATNAATSSAPDAAAPARAGQWIHVDPQTGQRIPPPAGRAAVAVDPAFSSSHQGLVEEAAPGGGVMIDLQGRFRSAATATIERDGKAHLDCVPPGMGARKE
jgi:hypothetical protein